MNADQQKENMRMLASILGLHDEEAAALLSGAIQITWSRANVVGATLGGCVAMMLRRTFATVGTPEHPAPDARCELCINDAKSVVSGASQLRARIDRQGLNVGRHVEMTPIDRGSVPNILVLLAACFASAAVANVTVGLPPGWTSPEGIQINFADWPGVPLETFELETALGRCFLVGAGAVGNAFTFALKYLPTTGELVVVDPKKVTTAIVNRCLWFDDGHVGQWKAECLAYQVGCALPKVSVRPFVGTLQQYRTQHQDDFECLIVGVDSRLVRRRLQEEVPLEVVDASTTGVEEVVFHHNIAGSGMACLGCVYNETEGERSFARHVAEVLNVSIEQVDAGFITSDAADRIAARYPELQQPDLIGKAFDTIFKQLCATQTLKTTEQQQVLAPFAFVSQLAGTIAAIELFLRRRAVTRAGLFNYWRVSPWRGLNVDLQQRLGVKRGCKVCGDAAYQALNATLWARESTLDAEPDVALPPGRLRSRVLQSADGVASKRSSPALEVSNYRRQRPHHAEGWSDGLTSLDDLMLDAADVASATGGLLER